MSAGSFTGDFSTGDLSQYVNVHNANPLVQRAATDRIQVVTTPAKAGQVYVARFEVRNGDVEPVTGSNRAEVFYPQVPDALLAFQEGEDRFFGFGTYLASDFPTDATKFCLLQQWKQDGGGSPPLALEAFGERFRIGRNLSPVTDYYLGPLVRGRWVTWVVRVKFSDSSTTGFVEVWRDGVKRELLNGSDRYPAKTKETGLESYWKQGIYRDPSYAATAISYTAASKWAGSYEAAAPIVEGVSEPAPPRKMRGARPGRMFV